MRVLVADDRALVRAGIRALLERMEDVKVVREAADGSEAIRLAEQFRPDVVLMDLGMPEMDGIEATRHIVRDLRIKVLILTMHDSEFYVAAALHAGASGYVLKDASAGDLENALRAAGRGEKYVSPEVSELAERVLQTPAGSPLDRLTRRQREILQLIAEGRKNADIAARLRISVKTVEAHRSHLMETLNIHDIAGLVRFAIRVGLIGPGGN